jgi:hypothetical protein
VTLWNRLHDYTSDWGGLWKALLVGLACLMVGLLAADCFGGTRQSPIPCEVTAHGHRPAYTTYETRCLSRDTAGVCTSSIVVPVHHPPEWWLIVTTAQDRRGVRVNVDPHTWSNTPNHARGVVSCRRGAFTNTCWLPRLSLPTTRPYK